MSFFISFIQRAALSQHKLWDNEWCHCSSEGFRVVSLNDLHYFNMNFVNKSDSCFISSIEGTALSQCEFCEQEWCQFSSEGIPLNDLHYHSMNFVNKSEVMFHQFHWISCTISMWILWTRVTSFFFYWKYSKLLNHCDCVYLCNSKQRWCDISSEGFPSVPLNELHCPDVNFMDKSRVISGLQTLPLR